ncbi:hypothetical protein FISHEDRAFT_60641 [Fistulina hepatica ATCC 64428]|uniref:Tetraspannin-domain-containing protein n=1 Tax=Fistulina hepatica ATCC 64428 TaxID=1128425 RepID=A0A0D7A8B5_9AGAR|nr:hypothetical protein FISHEDRAFT_60641 [Fistulina hepatica ATCC 64428]
MGFSLTRHFCCCIPVRAGVIIIALFGLVLGGFITVAGSIQAAHATGNKVSYIIQILVYAILALFSVFGLVGAISKKRGMVRGFSIFLIVHLLLSIASGIYSLWSLFNQTQSYVNECVSQSGSGSTANCKSTVKTMKGVMVTVFICIWLIEIYGCMIVHSFWEQLRDENEMGLRNMAWKNAA